MIGQLDIHHNAELLTHAAAGHISALLTGSVHTRGRALIALSGGSTPRGVYTLLGSEPMRSRIPWKDVHLFWGDERCVPPTDRESNFRMVHEAMLQHITIPPENIHRVMAENDPGAAAQSYEADLQQISGTGPASIPVFDVVVLGLGTDGHTASLFPGTPALDEMNRLVTDVYVEKLRARRITMTFPVINNARHILVLVSGEEKAGILEEVLRGDSLDYPIQKVRPAAGDLRWLVDRDAASKLASSFHS